MGSRRPQARDVERALREVRVFWDRSLYGLLSLPKIQALSPREEAMKSRDVVGRRIVEVRQQRYFNRWSCLWQVKVGSIVLDDGAVIVLSVQQDEDDAFVQAVVLKGKGK